MWQIIEQVKAIKLFERSILDGHLSHAYLFVGPPHSGKRTLAINLAQAVNCNESVAPCGLCESCKRIFFGKHADVLLVGLISKEKKEIGIDQIREIQGSSCLPPYEGRKKVFIIDNADLLSNEASNCLLKILEEPPLHALIILLTANEKILLPTITSRCQRIELQPLPRSVIKEVISRKLNLPEHEIDLRVRLSDGCLGWALQSLNDDQLLNKRTEILGTLMEVISVNRNQRLNYAAEMAAKYGKDKEDVEEIIALWTIWWHDLLLLKFENDNFIINLDHNAELLKQVKNYSTGQVKGFIKSLQNARDQLEQNSNPRLALELLLLNMP